MCFSRGRLCFPPCHWEHPAFMGLSPKSTSQTRQNWFIKPQRDPSKISLSTSKSQLAQTPPKAFSVLQGVWFIHEVKLPDHTLARQLCPLSPTSAAFRGKEKQNHHLQRPQQISQVCWWPETTETANLPQECVKEREAMPVWHILPSSMKQPPHPLPLGRKQPELQLPLAAQLQCHGSRASPSTAPHPQPCWH